MNRGQLSMLDEIIVDNFAGGGGASTGIEFATGRPVTIAINHDPAAILMHKTNHPYTEHLQASVWDVNPEEVCAGRPVGLAWFSPDCKHFSKAKGAALVDRNIRGLAWIVLRWAGTVKPRVIILENVEEFQTWGPVRKGKPVKKKAGCTFQKWLGQLKDLGYTVEFRVLIAADYGAPTSRKRFVLIARCDGRPIVWPERTHAPAESAEVKCGKYKPWRSAAEIIDWSLPCPSVFATKSEIQEQYGIKAVRPLADNTMRRVIRGVDKFTIRSGKPFIVPTGYGERKGQAPRVHDIDAPVPTVVGTGKENLCKPLLTPASEPVHTVTSAGNQILVTPVLVECNHSGDGHVADVRTSYKTITSKHTGGIVAPSLIQYHTEQTEAVRANGVETPVPTVDASNRYGLTCANLVEYYSNGRPLDVAAPMHTITSHDREALAAVHVQKYFSGVDGADVNSPLPTVTAIDHNSVCAAHIAEFKGQDKGQSMDRPLRTITASIGEFAEVQTKIVQYAPGADLKYWPKVRALLNKHCGYSLSEDEVLLLHIRDIWYFISDIGLRMLTPRELYAAMGFPPDYIIDKDYKGNDYPKSQQVARCGNAVCPPMATAVVMANLPEWSRKPLTTMSELASVVAV